ncbi:MAG TPA: 5'-3' exonuclease H3TH domain-containing protein, partial [Acidimicrobiia bacterium]|nr:5'-3' exonuclease H3TH domain-containing protein [Acidimicrobiia bacterium]
MPTLALIDGNSIAYRAFYALPEDLATKSGQITNAVFGFTRMLIRLIKDHHPEGVAVAWDVSRQTFRTESYPEYKANRNKAPDHFRSQLPLIDEVLQALNITQLREEGYEADDIIASLTKQATSDGWDVLIVTGDRDAFQLVGDNVNVLYTRRGISDTVLADEDWVADKYGISPAQYIEYAALRGDTSDNLPGVPGVGEKTAAKLIAEYGNIDGVFTAVADQTPRLRENLSAHRDQVFLNRELMALVDDLTVGRGTSEFETREWDKKTVKDLFDSLEFHTMWNDLEEALPSTGGATEVLEIEAELVTTADRVAALADRDRLVVGLVSDGGEPYGLAVSTGEGTSVVIPMDAAEPILERISSGDIAVAGHDLKSLARALLELGHDLTNPEMDTALASYIINPSQRTYELEEIAERVLGLELMSPDDEDNEGMLPFDQGPDVDLEGRRVEAVRQLVETLRDELEMREELDLFNTYELPLVPVLARMEHAGIGVDRAYLEEMGSDLRTQIAILEKKCHELAGEPFNVNSTDQLRAIL